MKVLMVINALGSVYGGPPKIVMELAQALGSQGIHVDIVTTNANGHDNLEVPLEKWVSKNPYRIQYFPRWHYAGEFMLSWPLNRWFFKHVSDYDIVHTHGIFSFPVLPAYWACQAKKVPYVVAPHGMLEPWALEHKKIKKYYYYRCLEKPALNRAYAIHLTATPEAEHIAPLKLRPPQVVIPNGVHLKDFDILPDAELFFREFSDLRGKRLVLFLGRIDPKKGLDLLAPAFERVRRQFNNLHLVIAGPDNISFLSTAQSFFSKEGCLEAVTFTGMLTGSLKYAALAAASVYIAPSYSEGFSMSVLEGMASGLPCVLTTGCNFPEAGVAHAAKIVDINSEAIAEALLDCFVDRRSAVAMGARARQFVFEHYTWDRIASRLIQLYDSVLKEKSAPAL